MDKKIAIQLAERERSKDRQEAFSMLGNVEQRFIEVSKTPEGEESPLVRDTLVWIVKFQKNARWIEYAVDCRESIIVRSQKSK